MSSPLCAAADVHATYANCFGGPAADLVLTEEPSVAIASPNATIVDRLIDPDVAQSANVALWELAFAWTQVGGEDVTIIDGVSSADLGGVEAAVGALLPAGRGALGLLAAVDSGAAFDRLSLVVPITGTRAYRRTERVQAAAAAAAARFRYGDEVVVATHESRDGRNAPLTAKYGRVRDIDPLSIRDGTARGTGRALAVGAANVAASISGPKRGRTLALCEYNPTRAFADKLAHRRDRPWRLAYHHPSAARLVDAARFGDCAARPFRNPSDAPDPEVRAALQVSCAARSADLEAAFTVAGVPLWSAVGPDLIDIAARYATFARGALPALRRELQRLTVDAVLVPFDTPPEARVLVRAAQSLGIPTYVINDGFKGDDFTVEGLSTDVALSWSTAIADSYYGRRAGRRTIVTGNPKADAPTPRRRRPPGTTPPRVLVGSFTFSPSDINCHRSDAETFLEGVLSAIRASSWSAGAAVTLKLHPADPPDHYAAILSAFADLTVDVIGIGDVVDLFGEHDLYITTYSTSLLEAARAEMPFIYYRVNEQRLHAPFAGTGLLARRTATDARELAALMDDVTVTRLSESAEELRAWTELYLGPQDGESADRILRAIEQTSAARI